MVDDEFAQAGLTTDQDILNRFVGTMSEENDNSKSNKSNDRSNSQQLFVSVDMEQRNSLNPDDVSNFKQILNEKEK